MDLSWAFSLRRRMLYDSLQDLLGVSRGRRLHFGGGRKLRRSECPPF
jgi:hypothetical protein